MTRVQFLGTALNWAVQKGDLEFARLLLERGANVEAKSGVRLPVTLHLWVLS